MDLLPEEEQAAVAEAARSVLTSLVPLTDAGQRARTGEHDPTHLELWSACADQGWFALTLPEEAGGVGYGLAEETLVLEQVGRHAIGGPFVGTLLAARMAARSPETQDLFAALLSGEQRAGLALPGQPGARSYDGDGVDHVVVLTPDRAELVAVTDPRAQTVMDPAATLVDWQVSGPALASVTAEEDDLWSRAAVLLAAQLAGLTAAACEQSTEYALTRQQFGTPIGAFQAVKHRCADAAVNRDAARHLTTLAALSLDAGHPDARSLAASALLLAGDRAMQSTADNIQNHGGIGFTSEATAHLLLKRAITLRHALGHDQLLRTLVLEPRTEVA